MATDGSFASSVNNETYVYSNYLTFDKNLEKTYHKRSCWNGVQ
jgi:hypothetical protein